MRTILLGWREITDVVAKVNVPDDFDITDEVIYHAIGDISHVDYVHYECQDFEIVDEFAFDPKIQALLKQVTPRSP